jgi:hypothetical protein
MLAKIREAQDDVDSQLPSMLYAQMWQDHNLARFDAAEAGARTLLRLVDETANYGFRLNARMVLAAVATYRGDLAKATELLIPVADDHQASDESGVPRLRLMQGSLKAGTGDFAASLAILGRYSTEPKSSAIPGPGRHRGCGYWPASASTLGIYSSRARLPTSLTLSHNAIQA